MKFKERPVTENTFEAFLYDGKNTIEAVQFCINNHIDVCVMGGELMIMSAKRKEVVFTAFTDTQIQCNALLPNTYIISRGNEIELWCKEEFEATYMPA